MGEVIEKSELNVANQLEQVYINMPEVRFYFSGDREQSEGNLEGYLGSERLQLQSLQRFSESGGGIYYYLLLDVSASIPESQFGRITSALSEFCQSVRPQDHVVFLTFGEEVEILFDMGGEELAEGAASDALLQLANRDQRTLLFEAVQKTAELAGNVPASESTRRVAFVITDGEDIAKGKATRDEALQTLQKNGIPLFGFTMDDAGRSAVNAFGEFSRAAGGYLTMMEPGLEKEGLEAVSEGLLASYEAIFSADTNLVSHETVSAVLEFVGEGEKQQRDVLQNRWIKDEVSPVVREAASEGTRQVRVLFSEPVDGTGAADNFRLEKDGEALVPEGEGAVWIERDGEEDGFSRTGGKGIGEEGVGEAAIGESGGKMGYVAGGIVVALLLCMVGFLLAWRRLKKQKAIVTVEGKAVLGSNVEVRQHVSLERQELEEKKVYFHVAGQREEIPVIIQKSMIVGRSSTCELIFDDPVLSRQHFALELADGGVTIRNLSQSGFTTVNGVRLGAGALPLHSGDQIGAGQLKLTVRW